MTGMPYEVSDKSEHPVVTKHSESPLRMILPINAFLYNHMVDPAVPVASVAPSLEMFLFLSLFFSTCLLTVTHGAIAVEECQMVAEKPGPKCCQHQKEKEDKEKDAEMAKFMQECVKQYNEGLTEPSKEDAKLSLMECVGECFFNFSKLLTPDMKLDKEMIMKMDDSHEENPNWKAVDETAMNTCFDKSEAEVRGNAKCKSGSFQLLRCVMRERFFNCPKEAWTENVQCADYKRAVERCTDVVPELHE